MILLEAKREIIKKHEEDVRVMDLARQYDEHSTLMIKNY